MKLETKQNGDGVVDVKIPVRTIIYIVLAILGINAGTTGVMPKLFSNDNDKYVTIKDYENKEVRDSSHSASIEMKINILLHSAGYNPETLIKYENEHTNKYNKRKDKR